MKREATVLLGVVALVVGLEALAYLTMGILGFFGAASGVGLGVGLILSACGVGLLYAAWSMRRGRAWARAPIIVAQLIQLLLANDARDGAAWLMPTMAASALVVLGCLLAPPVTRALSRDRPV